MGTEAQDISNRAAMLAVMMLDRDLGDTRHLIVRISRSIRIAVPTTQPSTPTIRAPHLRVQGRIKTVGGVASRFR